MSPLIISFCNLSTPGPALGVFDFDSEQFSWIRPEQAHLAWYGVDGICQRAGAYWFLPQVAWGGISALARLGEKPGVTFYAPLAKTRDAHALVPFQDGFLVADTQRNRLMYVKPKGDGTVEESEYWRCCDEEHDLYHVNSVARFGSDIYVSLLGRKPAEGWAQAREGKILNISQNIVICDHLSHPHSLTNIQDCLYWVESRTGAVHCFDPARGHKVVARLRCYLRGLSYDEEYLYVGASGRRPVSRSTGLPNPMANQEAHEALSWIYRLHRANLHVEWKRAREFPLEIFDVARISSGQAQVYLRRMSDRSGIQQTEAQEKPVKFAA